VAFKTREFPRHLPHSANEKHNTIDTQKITFLFSSIYRTIKNRFSVQQHVVRAFQTTSQLLEVVKVPPFADSVSEGDVK
jgi:regulator of sirC expression with transglutaminase-like and TPR domain